MNNFLTYYKNIYPCVKVKICFNSNLFFFFFLWNIYFFSFPLFFDFFQFFPVFCNFFQFYLFRYKNIDWFVHFIVDLHCASRDCIIQFLQNDCNSNSPSSINRLFPAFVHPHIYSFNFPRILLSNPFHLRIPAHQFYHATELFRILFVNFISIYRIARTSP